jgi:hypothetical protein
MYGSSIALMKPEVLQPLPRSVVKLSIAQIAQISAQ